MRRLAFPRQTGRSEGIEHRLSFIDNDAVEAGVAEPRVCSMVPIPDEVDEDERRRVREREDLVAERGSLVNRIDAVLATVGARDYNPLRRDRRARLEALRTALGGPLPPHAHARILRMLDRLELVCAQIAELERERDTVLEEKTPDKAEEMIRQLTGLRGIGPPCQQQ